MSEEKVKSRKKEFIGIVKNKKSVEEGGKVIGMDKTIVVSVETRALHPLYKKYIKRVKKIKAHDEKNEARTGDRVRVVESRPVSREKRWRLVEVIERVK